MPTPLPALTLRQARLHLQEYGHCPSGTINERLLRSWQRSLAAGLQPVGGLRHLGATVFGCWLQIIPAKSVGDETL